MKSLVFTLLLTSSLALGGCAQTLEQIVDEHHNARLDATYNTQPLRHGAGDGIGSRNAHVPETTTAETPADARLSLAAPPQSSPEPGDAKDH